MADSLSNARRHWILRGWDAKIVLRGLGGMHISRKALVCKTTVPAAMEAETLCILHFTLDIEQRCEEMRRETATGRAGRDRQVEIINYVGGRGELLARTATS